MSYLRILHAYLRSLLSMSTCSSLEELNCYQHRHKTLILLINIKLPDINQLLIIHIYSVSQFLPKYPEDIYSHTLLKMFIT